MAKENRGKLDDTLAAMFSNIEYRGDYLFYAHMIGQCSIKIDTELNAPAGVAFSIDHYNLYINPNTKYIPLEMIEEPEKVEPEDIVTHEGVQCIKIPGFDDFTLLERLAVLKHEMLHILYDHVGRKDDRDMDNWNYAADCALNQQIQKDHLPKDHINPDVLAKQLKIKVPSNESSEFYYELLKKNNKNKDGSCSDMGNLLDDHSKWGESVGDGELQKDITKKMIDRASDETIKGKGTIPTECSEWLSLHSRKNEVNWKKVLRGIVGNKRVGTRTTIMRKDRRFPNRSDLRGKTKDRKFNLLVVADVSGSMDDEDVLQTLGEVRHICDMTKTDVDLIQIDTNAYKPEKLTSKTSIIERKGNGGTSLHPALDMAKQYKIDYQAVVVLTDGGLWDGDIDHFQALGKKIIWLVATNGYVMPEMNTGKMKAFQLKNKVA